MRNGKDNHLNVVQFLDIHQVVFEDEHTLGVKVGMGLLNQY